MLLTYMYTNISMLSHNFLQYQLHCTVVPPLRDPPDQRPPLIPDRFLLARTFAALIYTPRERPTRERDQRPAFGG